MDFYLLFQQFITLIKVSLVGTYGHICLMFFRVELSNTRNKRLSDGS